MLNCKIEGGKELREMDNPCSSSPQYKGLVPRWEAPIYEEEGQHHHHHHHLCHGKEWLSSSARSSSVADAANKIDAYSEDNDDQKSQGGGGICGGTLIEREHMFDKVVTPSDVGKLNRLVIPKQHAEKYFPLDPSSNEKGLLLNFEDRTGKPWRFRYSYWNSSQSYVMTKGWSRFVKDKKLDAGDIISFQRGIGENEDHKLFIDWRRRPLLPPPPLPPAFSFHHHYHQQYHRSVPAAAWTPTFLFRSHPHPSSQSQGTVWDHPPASSHFPRAAANVIDRALSHSHPHWRGTSTAGAGHYACGFGNVVNPYPATGSVIFLRSSSSDTHPHHVSSSSDHHQGVVQEHGEEGGAEPMVFDSVPVVQGKVASKRLRLFGVNMDCPISHQAQDYDILSSVSASATPTLHHHHEQHRQQKCATTADAVAMATEIGPPYSSSSSANQHHLPLRLRLYNSASIPTDFNDKGKSSLSSSMSLDLDI